MKHQARILLAIVFTCFLTLFTVPQSTLSKEAVKTTDSNKLTAEPKANTLKAIQKPVSNPASNFLSIKQILLKNGSVHIVLEASAKISRTDYSAVKLQVKTKEHKMPGNWTLRQVDPKGQLSFKKGTVIFDTKMKLNKRGIVQATLLKGKWKISKSATLGLIAIAKAKSMKNRKAGISRPAVTARKVESVKKPAAQRASNSNSNRAAGDSARAQNATRALNDTGGIRCSVPREDHIINFGDGLRVEYRFLEGAEAGRTTLTLTNATATYATLELDYNPDTDGDTVETYFEIPETGFPAGTNYFIHIRHSDDQWGNSNWFTIQSGGEATIRFRNPTEGSEEKIGSKIDLSFFFSQGVDNGSVTFNLFKFDHDGAYSTPIETFILPYRGSGSSDHPTAAYRYEWRLSNPLTVGRYFITANHFQAYGESGTFTVDWLRDREAEGSGRLVRSGDGTGGVRVYIASHGHNLNHGDRFRVTLSMITPDEEFPSSLTGPIHSPSLFIHPEGDGDPGAGELGVRWYFLTPIDGTETRSNGNRTMQAECVISDSLEPGGNYVVTYYRDGIYGQSAPFTIGR